MRCGSSRDPRSDSTMLGQIRFVLGQNEIPERCPVQNKELVIAIGLQRDEDEHQSGVGGRLGLTDDLTVTTHRHMGEVPDIKLPSAAVDGLDLNGDVATRGTGCDDVVVSDASRKRG